MILKTVIRFGSFLNRTWSPGAPRRYDFKDNYTFQQLFEIEVGPAKRPEGMIFKTVIRFGSFLK